MSLLNIIKSQLIGDAIESSLNKSDVYRSIYKSLVAPSKMDTDLEMPDIDLTLVYLTDAISDGVKIPSRLSEVSSDEITLPAALCQEYNELGRLRKLVVSKFHIINKHLSSIESGSYEDAYKEAVFLIGINRAIEDSMFYLIALATDNVKRYGIHYRFGSNMELTPSGYVRDRINEKMRQTQIRHSPVPQSTK